MERVGKEVLQVSKEIAIKFIETQRMSPSNFGEIFPSVYKVVLETVIQGENALHCKMSTSSSLVNSGAKTTKK